MSNFKGFQPQDFGDLEGSTWRSRDSLGGMLSAALQQQFGRPYQSWGVRRTLELHLAIDGIYKFDYPWPHAKLFVASYTDLTFGFYIETPEATNKHITQYKNWLRFRDCLQKSPAMQTSLLAAMANYDLTMANYCGQGVERDFIYQFQFCGGYLCCYQRDNPTWRKVPTQMLFQYLKKFPGDQWVDFYIFAKISKQSAIKMGPRVVDKILPVLRALAPVYEMTIK